MPAGVDRFSAQAARELLRQRSFSQAVAACRDALARNPDDVDARLLLARALMALGRDGEAQVEVAAALRRRAGDPEAYQLLGELAFRRDELRAAEVFLREALRLHPDDARSRVLLDVILAQDGKNEKRPAAAAAKLPAAPAAAGPFSRNGAHPRRGASDGERTVLARQRDRSVAVRVDSGGFGEYLVRQGVLSRTQLLSVLQRHYLDGCRVGDAAVRLGYASPERIESLASRYHAGQRAATPRTAAA